MNNKYRKQIKTIHRMVYVISSQSMLTLVAICSLSFVKICKQKITSKPVRMECKSDKKILKNKFEIKIQFNNVCIYLGQGKLLNKNCKENSAIGQSILLSLLFMITQNICAIFRLNYLISFCISVFLKIN